jgi:hypothetical protein
MSKIAYVIMNNLYPEAAVIGTKEESEAKKNELRTEYARVRDTMFCHWHVKEVPLFDERKDHDTEADVSVNV